MKLISAFVLALVVLFSGAADASTVLRQTLNSKTLGRQYPYTIYLPSGYAQSDLHYPVLYLLHGANGNENDWLVNVRVQPVLDKLMDAGEIPSMIVVMPGHPQAWWTDGNNEKGESALLRDLIPHIEANYKTIPEPTGRLIGGLSAGGYGTANVIMKYPEMFAAGAALSPAGGSPIPHKDSSAFIHKQFQTDGKFDPSTWQHLYWPSYFEAYKQKDIKVPLFIASGDHDRFDITYHSAVLYQKLREHQPTLVEFRVVDGDHDWPTWQATISEALTYMSKYITRPRGIAPK